MLMYMAAPWDFVRVKIEIGASSLSKRRDRCRAKKERKNG